MSKFKISLDEIKINTLLDYLKNNRKSSLKLVILLILIFIIIFLWFKGSDDTSITIEQDSDTNSPQQSMEYIDKAQFIYVDICGEVIKPGVYSVRDDTRLFQLIELAGGTTENAAIDILNRAELVYDGQKIIIPSIDQVSAQYQASQFDSSYSSGKININTADSDTLQIIPGIGQSKAERIIQYRKDVGRFKKIEDIKNVTGIGDKTFESIKEYITV